MKPTVSMDDIFEQTNRKRPTTDAQETDKQLINDAQETDSERTEGETPRRQIRISDADWSRLSMAARENGLSTSALVRQILREWMRKHV